MKPSPFPASTSGQLCSRGMLAVVSAQFLSAFADNALLFAAVALLRTQLAPAWQLPLLQEFFAIAFILLAPFVGPCADHWPKGRVMLVANGFKFLGVSAMISGLHPLLAYAMVGMGAAAYSPAKYGILSELVGPDALVKANSMVEGSTIVAILLGAVTGGLGADYSLSATLLIIAACYLTAAAINLLIPRLAPAHRMSGFAVNLLMTDFAHAVRTLYRHPDTRFSIIGTGIFWGAGSTMRFLLIAWVPVALNIFDNGTAAALSAAVAIGIAIGALLAARFVTLNTVNRTLPIGLLIGVFILLFGVADSLISAAILLVIIGACGGFYVVPLNALLQERGHESVGAGHAIAVQNFFENCGMLLMLGLYTLLVRLGVPVITSVAIFGAFILLGISLLCWWRLSRPLPQSNENH